MRVIRARGRPPRLALALALALALVTAAGPNVAGGRTSDQVIATQPPPNIVLVMSDDQTLDTFNSTFMPHTFENVVAHGTLFDQYVIPTPLCCPSRAAFLTGQYAHNNGVETNHPGYLTLNGPRNVLPVWMRSAGYRTAYFGKFLHGYEDRVSPPTTPAPGWSHWVGLQVPFRYYNYDLSIDGQRKHYGRAPGAYLDTQLTEQAKQYVETYAQAAKPVFMVLAYLAPHSAKDPSSPCHRSAVPAPQDSTAFSTAPLPVTPSFNEANVADKPSFIRRLTPLNSDDVVQLEQTYRCRAEALQGVDRGVQEVHDAFARAGELGNTVFIYTGDNGYFQGEHRLRRGKGLPYEESIRQPLAISMPSRYLGGLPQQPETSGLAANIDLAPTILDIAGAQPCRVDGTCRVLDGRSLMPLISGSGPWPEDRGVLLEYDSPGRGSGRRGEGGSCKYTGIRTPTQMYVVHTQIFNPDIDACIPAQEVEYYNLLGDPYELDNQDSPLIPPSTEERSLAARTDSLATCAGTPGNEVAGRPPCE